MISPEVDINNHILIKSLLIYEEYKKQKTKYINEKILKTLLNNHKMESAKEYYDCICSLYAIGMINENSEGMEFIHEIS